MPAAVSAVVQNSGGGTGVPSRNATIVCAGGTLVAICSGPNSTTHTVTDSVNGATGWTQCVAQTTTGGGGNRIFYRDSMAPGSTIVTDTYGASSGFCGLAIFEVTGTAGFDIASVLNNETTGTTRTSAATTPSATGIAVGYMYNDTFNGGGGTDTGSGWASMTGTGFTAGHFMDYGSGNAGFCWLESKSYLSLSALAATQVTVGGTDTTATCILMFKDLATGTSLAWIRA